MILAALPQTSRLVVSGIGPDYQASMKEMMQAMGRQNKCIVLFPSQAAQTFADLVRDNNICFSIAERNEFKEEQPDEKVDIIVLDGTWAQARKLHDRYIPKEAQGGPRRVKLASPDLERLSHCDDGLQLRKHPIQWKEISTLEALRLLLRDIVTHNNQHQSLAASSSSLWDVLASYQDIANSAAKRQRGR